MVLAFLVALVSLIGLLVALGTEFDLALEASGELTCPAELIRTEEVLEFEVMGPEALVELTCPTELDKSREPFVVSIELAVLAVLLDEALDAGVDLTLGAVGVLCSLKELNMLEGLLICVLRLGGLGNNVGEDLNVSEGFVLGCFDALTCPAGLERPELLVC